MNPYAPRGYDASSRFLVRLAGFFAFLRVRGMTVGIGAEIDLGQALDHLGPPDRERFRDACRAILAKSPSDQAILEGAFDAYWFAAPSIQDMTQPVDAPAVPASPPRDGRASGFPATERLPVGTRPAAMVQIGVYSPEAPPPGHPLRPLDRRRLRALRTGARRFRRLAATLPGRRVETARRGKIDFLATARHSLRHGGEWVDIHRKRRKRVRAELVILWDVSGSMREHDDGLLALVFVLHRVSRRSRVFAFSTHLEELTGPLAGRSYPRATEAVSRFLAPSGGGTRIGHCLEDFRRRYGAIVHPWTTVIILSDGWDLGEAELLARELDRLRRRAHLVAWVNPYAWEPGFHPATAGMRQALPYIDILLAPREFESRLPMGSSRARTIRFSVGRAIATGKRL